MTFRVPGAKNARLLFGAVLAIAAIGAASCGGGDDEPTAPSGSGVSTATFTIAVGGQISPTTATINRGDRVTFVNNDTVPHTMSSNPHPNHTDCPALNVGTLSTAQSRDSGTLNTARTCGFHDHDNPDSAGLKGTVVIQ